MGLYIITQLVARVKPGSHVRRKCNRKFSSNIDDVRYAGAVEVFFQDGGRGWPWWHRTCVFSLAFAFAFALTCAKCKRKRKCKCKK